LELAGEVRDSGVLVWHRTQSSQFVVSADDFSDDEAALISTSLDIPTHQTVCKYQFQHPTNLH
jgi:hypothetical protein